MIWFGYLQYLGYYVSSLLVDAEVRTVSSAIALIAFLLYRRYSHRIRETFTR
ncbi:MAG TPA: hypothetical protein PK765_01435 [bacterium]|nr:hypothetical protein [bacterium]